MVFVAGVLAGWFCCEAFDKAFVEVEKIWWCVGFCGDEARESARVSGNFGCWCFEAGVGAEGVGGEVELVDGFFGAVDCFDGSVEVAGLDVAEEVEGEVDLVW